METSHLFCFTKEMTDFYMKRNTGLKWVKAATLLKVDFPKDILFRFYLGFNSNPLFFRTAVNIGSLEKILPLSSL